MISPSAAVKIGFIGDWTRIHMMACAGDYKRFNDISHIVDAGCPASIKRSASHPLPAKRDLWATYLTVAWHSGKDR
jgi:hypothetical protein